MRVLVACEESGVVRDAFRALGHDAWSCDLQPASDHSPYHIVADATSILSNGWDLLIAHPPCTYLSNSGASRLYSTRTGLNHDRFNRMLAGAALFLRFWNAPIKYKCIENPIMHKWAKDALGPLPEPCRIQPYYFGHDESKATCLWLDNLPPLKPTSHFGGAKQAIMKLGPSADRAKLRSKTYPGIAAAMAQQWTEWILNFDPHLKPPL